MSEKTLHIVTGMHRSGTSLIAKMLEIFDVSLAGNLAGPAPDNEKGFWEDKDIVALNNEVLDKLDLQWDSLHGFFLTQNDFSHPRFNSLKHNAAQLLRERLAPVPHWACKDPRMSRLSGFWQSILEKKKIPYKYVITIRNPYEVAGSLEKRNGFANLKSLYLWFLYTVDILSSTNRQNRIVLNYESFVTHPLQSLKCIKGFFRENGLDYNAAKAEVFCADFVSGDLHHNIGYTTEVSVDLVDSLYRLLQKEVQPDGRESASFANKLSLIVQKYADDQELQSILEYSARTESSLRKDVQSLETEYRTRQEDFRKEEQRLITNFEAVTDDLKLIQNRETQLQESVAVYQDREAQLQESVAFHQNREDELKTALELQLDRAVALQSRTQLLGNQLEDAKTYQAKLEEDLEKQKNWTDKLQQRATEREEQLVQESEHSRELQSRLSGLEIQTRNETTRLWEIIEKYRLESEQRVNDLIAIQQTLSWRMTSPLRWTKYFIISIPRSIKRFVKATVKWFVYLLPEDSFARQAIVQSYRGLRGEIDHIALRNSHRAVISNRTQILGDKPSLDANELPDFDISIVTYNSQKWIAQFVSSLISQTYPLGKISLFVVDNGSTDETVKVFEQIFDDLLCGKLRDFKLIQSTNVGFGGGHNQGLAHATSEFVLVTNIDLEFTSDCLVRVVSFALQDEPEVASWELRQRPYEHPKYYDPVTLQTAWSSHACILIRREAFEQVDGYEERIFMYGEDVELSYRFASRGFKLRYIPAAVVHHHAYEEAGEVKPLQFAGSTLANAYIRLRYGSVIDILNIVNMYAKLLAADTGVPNGRAMVRQNVRKILRNFVHFLRTRNRPSRSFAFREWDYGICREGAFYTSPEIQTEQPLVSVITRTYRDRGALLRECMQSVMHQTYRNIELIVVEDGGNSLKKTVSEISEAYPNRQVKYQPLEKMGRCQAGNAGLEITTGKYVMFLDDDDLLFCDHVETCVLELESDSRLGAVYTLAWEVETDFNSDAATLYDEMSHVTADIMRQEFDHEVIRHHNFIAIQSILFARTLYEELGGFDPELDNLEDWNMWVRYSSQCDFKLIRKTTSMYRTPWDLGEKTRRQARLTSYYPKAQLKNQEFLQALSRRECLS